MDELDKLLEGLENPRVSTKPSQRRTASTSVNYDELNELMRDLAAPVENKNSYQASSRVSQSPASFSSHGSDGFDDYGNHNVRNTQQPIRNTQPPVRDSMPPVRDSVPSMRTTQPPARNTQSAAQLDDLDELLRNLGPPSATHAAPTPSYNPPQHDRPHQTSGSQFYDNRQSQAPVRNVAPVRTAQAVQAQPPPQQQAPRAAPTKPTGGRVLDGPDLDDMLRDISRSSTRGLEGGPSSRGECAHCRKPILGEVIQALNRTYHPEHFVCGNCTMPLGTNNFYEQDGVPNCERCYQELFCSRCAHCDEPITGKCITALNRKWHVDHFVCAQCLGPFAGGTFFEKEGRPYCENCFHNAFSSHCAGCNQVIRGECINALGQQWHPEHFVCHYCQKSFGHGSFYDFAGKPYCETHYHQQTGSQCAGCGKPVSGRMINALDKKWHPEHFVCSFCMHPLAGGAFTENGGKAYCKECHGKLFG